MLGRASGSANVVELWIERAKIFDPHVADQRSTIASPESSDLVKRFAKIDKDIGLKLAIPSPLEWYVKLPAGRRVGSAK